jgi:hypothetical protein
MAIHVTQLDDESILAEFSGLISPEAVVEHYEEVSRLNPTYVIVDDRNIMLSSDEAILNVTIQKLTEKMVTRNTLKSVILIIPGDHELRQVARTHYERMGVSHKLHFADDLEQAQQILQQLKNRSP